MQRHQIIGQFVRTSQEIVMTSEERIKSIEMILGAL